MTAILTALLGFLGAIVGAAIGAFVVWRISAEQAKNQFRLAALDRRLEIHQEAYILWDKLFVNLHNQARDISEIVLECQAWWIEHRVYLEPQSSEAFRLAYMKALTYRELPVDDDKTTEAFESIKNAGRLIVEAVSLPAVQGGEHTRIPRESLPKKESRTGSVAET